MDRYNYKEGMACKCVISMHLKEQLAWDSYCTYVNSFGLVI